MDAYVLVETAAGTGPVAGRLHGIPGVVFAEDVRGPHDVVVLARSDPGGAALDATLAEIRGMPGVIRALAAPLVGSSVRGRDPVAA